MERNILNLKEARASCDWGERKLYSMWQVRAAAASREGSSPPPNYPTHSAPTAPHPAPRLRPLHSGSEGGDDGARKMYSTRHKTLSAIITHCITCATTMYHQFYSRVSFSSLLKSYFGHLYLKRIYTKQYIVSVQQSRSTTWTNNKGKTLKRFRGGIIIMSRRNSRYIIGVNKIAILTKPAGVW